MTNGPLLDLYSTDAGEVTIGFNGDLQLARDEDAIVQEIKFRLATVRGDWLPEPECGADLELLIGQPNSPATGKLAESMISHALTHDGFFRSELKEIKVVPLSKTELLALVTVQVGDTPFTLPWSLDLREGIL